MGGLEVTVVNVHAGHNGTPRKFDWKSAVGAKRDIHEPIHGMGRSDVTLTGGDFNEMTKVMDRSTIGHGYSERRTHSMGANDKVGATGSDVFASSESLGNFGSDHCAIKFSVEVRPLSGEHDHVRSC